MEILIAKNLDIWNKVQQEVERIINSAIVATVNHLQKSDELESKELSVLLTGDDFIQDINRDFRGKDKPTNVISFPHMSYVDGELEEVDFSGIFGEIMISYDMLHREAEEQGKSFNDHLSHLVVHSTLHLFGYDHMEDGEADIMEGIEVEILNNMGIANPYK